MILNFREYQNAAAQTAIYPNKGNNLPYVVMGLMGEAGEIANKAKKILRDDKGTITRERADQLFDEIGDVLWYLSMIADELGFSLESIAAENIVKLQMRQKKGTLQGSGDSR